VAGVFVGLEGSQIFLFGQMIELLVPTLRLARLLPAPCARRTMSKCNCLLSNKSTGRARIRTTEKRRRIQVDRSLKPCLAVTCSSHRAPLCWQIMAPTLDGPDCSSKLEFWDLGVP
jgi:hypothetical protein